MRRRGVVGAFLAAGLLAPLAVASSATAVTTGNGALVYSPAAGSSFNPEGGRAAGTTYAKMIILKNSGAANGTQLVTFDQLVLENGVQVYPIYRSTNNGASWSRIAAVTPSTKFPSLTRTAQPSLYETPIQLGNLPAGARRSGRRSARCSPPGSPHSGAPSETGSDEVARRLKDWGRGGERIWVEAID